MSNKPWIANFMQKVQDMRKAQATYFKHRTQTNLTVAKQKEKEVDAVLSDAISKGFITAEPTKPTQLTINN